MILADNKKQKRIFAAAIILLSASLILAAALCPYFLDNAVMSAANETRLDYTDDSDPSGEAKTFEATGIEVVNLKTLGSVLYVNHTPGEFTDPFSLAGKAERVNNLTKADFGTLQFVFFNLDPMAEDFNEQADSLSRFRLGNENLINISLYLPAAFDAATVYCFNSYVSTVGDMGEYDPLKFVDSYLSDSFYTNQVGVTPQYIDMTFSTSRRTIPPDRFAAARIVTVHYHASGGVNFAGKLPLAGTKTALKSVADSKTNMYIALLSLTSVTAVSFAFLLLLKRKTGYVGQLGVLIGSVLLLAAGLLPLVGSSSAGAGLSVAASAILVFSAILAAYDKKNKRVGYIALCLAFVHLVLSIVLALMLPVGSTVLYNRIATSIIACTAVVLGAVKLRKDENCIAFSGIVVACVGSLLSAFMTFSPLVSIAPAEAVCSLSALVVLSLVFVDIFTTERQNRALTANLEAEVAAQTATLSNALSDREKILSFLSHDMKKSALGIKAMTEELERSAESDTVRNTADKIQTKNNILLQSFSEILRFTKRSFSDEPFSSFSLNELFTELDARVRADCDANGIVFSIFSKKIMVCAKRSALLSALFNLVFNAIEHSGCTRISVSAKKSGGRVLITVSDDGNGIGNAADVFSPYVSDNAQNESRNAGLGLFIVKSEIEAMGGTISYAVDKGSVFTLTLLCE